MRKKSVLHPFRHLAILIVAAGLLTGSCGCFYETSEEVIYPATAPNVSVSRESEPSTHRTETATLKTAETEEKKTTEEQSAESRCRKLLAQMTMEDQVAQLLMPEIRMWDVGDGQGEQPVTVLPEAVASLLSAYDFGGVILFAENCRDTGQLVTLTDALQQAGAAKQGIGLWIATDQEGGSVTRLSQGTQLIGNMALGAIGSEEAAEQAGEITGRELSALGIGLDLAPVLDVNSNPANPVIGIRSFSDDPELTGALGDAFIRGLHESGTLTAVKHYPGHGDTLTDSHTNLPVMNCTLDELRQSALVPFATCVDDEGEQTDFVMAAHICFPQIESGTYQSKLDGQEITLPATFSRILISDILRDELGFDGVVITDSMQMKAIADHFTPLDAARLALNAGVDMLLMPVNIRSTADIGEMETYIRQVAELVRKGEIPQERIEEAVLRVLMMKDRYGLLDIRTQEENEPLEERIRQAQEIVGSEAHHAAEWELALQAVTLVKDTEGLLPLSPKSRVILACPDSARFLSLKYALYRLQEDQILPEDADVAVACYEGMSEADATNMAWQSDVVVVVSSVTGWKELGKEDVPSAFIDKLIQAAHGLDRQVIVISSGLPYDVNRFPDADVVLACYSPEGMKELPPETEYGANLPAAIYSLFSGQELSGRLPVEIPALSEYSNLTE